MHVLIVSQCSGAALNETRRIVDQFAERKCDRAWQTPITQQGLKTLRMMLRRSARKNTAVACHWIKSGNRTELLWIVGKLTAFSEDGTVPTGSTSRDILRTQDENQWNTLESIALLSAIAGLFHDFGKSSQLFQAKLRGDGELYEPYRHEWISLRLFESFVAGRKDKEWLTDLISLTSSELSKRILHSLGKETSASAAPNPFSQSLVNPLSRCIGWLILSHHRIPFHPRHISESEGRKPKIKSIDEWLVGKKFGPKWNSLNMTRKQWSEKEWQSLWNFKNGLPSVSHSWLQKARWFALRGLRHKQLLETSDWISNPFVLHLARLCLMLGDYVYSSGDRTEKWCDQSYLVYANTEKSGGFKQQLDEHCVGVAVNAFFFGRHLPNFLLELPSIGRHQPLRKRTEHEKFRWQNHAFDFARAHAKQTSKAGFFGINMASTGFGKTLANARIMYGLSDDSVGARFTVALGLRNLTLQTGEAFRELLKFDVDDLAVIIGSARVRDLFEASRSSVRGSDSSEALIHEHLYVRYEGSLYSGRYKGWLENSSQLNKLVSAPVVVCTIDQLIRATETLRGGKQIAPILRLLSSDLVLDEPDDFGLEDLPALSRLVHWAGVFGSRVLLSSATLSPALVEGLFEAYRAGREVFNRNTSDEIDTGVLCAWFDEFGKPQSERVDELSKFRNSHSSFIKKRAKQLEKSQQKRLGSIVPCESNGNTAKAVSQTLRESVCVLHENHHSVYMDKRISFGLVRFANINSLVAVARSFLTEPAEQDSQIFFCVYHSQFPMVQRSRIEEVLDKCLNRSDADSVWQHSTIKKLLSRSTQKNIIFIVFATPVAEVGRDHDYDWAFIEPSSVRSMVQLAGRVLRHRNDIPSVPNLHLMSQNCRALDNKSPCFYRPGYETSEIVLSSTDLNQVLRPDEYRSINSIVKILEPEELDENTKLSDLEHCQTRQVFFGTTCRACLWWTKDVTWCGELQRRTPFRKSFPRDPFILFMEDEGSVPEIFLIDSNGDRISRNADFTSAEFICGEHVEPWLKLDVKDLTIDLAQRFDIGLEEASIKFTEFSLPKDRNEKSRAQGWSFHPQLGFFRPKWS